MILKSARSIVCIFNLLVACCVLLVATGCSQKSVERGAQGAATGAVVGAVGGLVTGLVFGGNAAESAARGAVYGGATGATAGAISGAVEDSNQKKAQQAAELEALRKELGDDAFQGLAALAECKHEIALGYGRTATQSDNPNYALAGLWVEALTYADSGQESKARSLFPDLVAKDASIETKAQAESELDGAMQQLYEIRRTHKLPEQCDK